MLCLAPPVYLALAGQPSQAHWPGGQVQATPTPWQLKIMVSNWLLEFKTTLGISPLSSQYPSCIVGYKELMTYPHVVG